MNLNVDYNKILKREQIYNSIKNILAQFEHNKNNHLFKRGIYIYGDPGSGKTEFITKLLKELNYDIIKFDAGDIRNKSIIDTITKNNMSEKSVFSLFKQTNKRIAIIMDEIDGMNNGDKGGINSLIKIIRPKKTKKQKLEEISLNPIICISSYHVDKKIKELMKVCNTFEIKSPMADQIKTILKLTMPSLEESIILNTQKLFNQAHHISEHNNMMNDTDRTTVGLLWHENIIDYLDEKSKSFSIPVYSKILDKICFADYIDRITFQKQIWQFNEMSSLIKTFHCNKIYHDFLHNTPPTNKMNEKEIRFTKVLTKYSTEYNNSLFIQELCQKLSLDKKDTFSFFLNLRNNYTEHEIFELYDINKLDVNRIYRYIDKYTNKDFTLDNESVNEDITDDMFKSAEEEEY